MPDETFGAGSAVLPRLLIGGRAWSAVGGRLVSEEFLDRPLGWRRGSDSVAVALGDRGQLPLVLFNEVGRAVGARAVEVQAGRLVWDLDAEQEQLEFIDPSENL